MAGAAAKFLLALAGMAMLATSAFAQSAAQSGGTNIGKTVPPRGPDSVDERMAMPRFPGGWIAHPPRTAGSVEVADFTPKGQSPAQWNEKISLEIHHGTNTLPPDAFQGRALAHLRDSCEGVIERPVQTGMNNGFPSAFWVLGCTRAKHENFGEVRYSKAVQARDTLYLLTRSWRTRPYPKGEPPITERQAADAVAFLSSSVVCSDAATHPCPTEAATK